MITCVRTQFGIFYLNKIVQHLDSITDDTCIGLTVDACIAGFASMLLMCGVCKWKCLMVPYLIIQMLRLIALNVLGFIIIGYIYTIDVFDGIGAGAAILILLFFISLVSGYFWKVVFVSYKLIKEDDTIDDLRSHNTTFANQFSNRYN